MFRLVFILLFFPFLFLQAENIVFSKTWGENIPVRESPTTRSSEIITTIQTATSIQVLGKASQKVKIGSVEDYWYKIRIHSDGKEGWIFGAYLLQEGSQELKESMSFIVQNLYHFLPDIQKTLEQIKNNRKNILSFIRSLSNEKRRFLHYYAYHFLLEKDELAVPLLIEFMNPQDEALHQEDVNYLETWTYLNKLIPAFLNSDYASYKKWWFEQKRFQFNPNDQTLMEIFTHIRKNEDKQYRSF
ncbi:MAG: SH3 domain-containing protein [Deltaproteobacteria bacterium]|nr:SH3 domain-containing protein [Deltaproteobacteria bacterium]